MLKLLVLLFGLRREVCLFVEGEEEEDKKMNFKYAIKKLLRMDD